MRQLPPACPLAREEEGLLAALAKTTDEKGEKALRKIIECHLRLVVSIAWDHINMGIEIEDLIAEGNIGLMKAAGKFDPETGNRLSTYASWWIKESIKNAIFEQARTIRIPKRTLEKIVKIKQIIQALSCELKREPTLEEISDETQIDLKKLRSLIEWDIRPISIHTEINSTGEELITAIIDERTCDPADGAGNTSDKKWVESILTTLKPKEKQIIESRFGWGGDPKTLEEIGLEMDLTRERVRQIEKISLEKLKKRILQLERELKQTLPR